MPDQDLNLEGKFQARQEYESICKTSFWQILSQEVDKKMKQHQRDVAGIDLGAHDGVAYASRVQGRHQSLEWLVRTIQDIRDGKISLKTP